MRLALTVALALLAGCAGPGAQLIESKRAFRDRFPTLAHVPIDTFWVSRA